jgi:Ca-activated chloride channel family protein
MRHGRNPRRALVVLSDGEDNFSRYGEGELKAFLREAEVVIYSVGLATGKFGLQGRCLRRLSEETGGWNYPVTKLEELGHTVRAISDAIRGQYLVAYSSSNLRADGKYRRIRVQVGSTEHPEWSSSWRNGYYAPSSR